MRDGEEPKTRDVVAMVALHGLLSGCDGYAPPEEVEKRAYSIADKFIAESEKAKG